MNNHDHLTDDLLIRDLDEEVSATEAARMESHLAICNDCKRRYQRWHSLSINLKSLLDTIPGDTATRHRDVLERRLRAQEGATVARAVPEKVLRRLGWAVGVAAALIIAILVLPQATRTTNSHSRISNPTTVRAEQVSTGMFEINGEAFTQLPYSNPDLPLSAAHIVRIQIPIASLAIAGVKFEPASYEVSRPDRSVAADVLFGMDGQPLGVHIFNEE